MSKFRKKIYYSKFTLVPVCLSLATFLFLYIKETKGVNLFPEYLIIFVAAILYLIDYYLFHKKGMELKIIRVINTILFLSFTIYILV